MVALSPAMILAVVTSMCAPDAGFGPMPMAPPGAIDVDPEELLTGLVATYRQNAPSPREFTRVEAKPAFATSNGSLHPRLAPGPFSVEWRGVIRIQDSGGIRARALVGGECLLEIDETTLLQGEGRSRGAVVESLAPLERPPGLYRFRCVFRSREGVAPRLRVEWSGPGFGIESIPAWRFGHLKSEETPEFARDQLAERGRVEVERLGCARCHASSFPGVGQDPPGPSLADAPRRLGRDWIRRWLENPTTIRPQARMPALFPPGRAGEVERVVIANHLVGQSTSSRTSLPPPGDHRAGRLAFLSIGCVACHEIPDSSRGARGEPSDSSLVSLEGLGDRLPPDALAEFLGNPRARYPDGRMPRFPLNLEMARDIAAYLILWNPPSLSKPDATEPTTQEIADLGKRLGVSGRRVPDVASALLAEKGCAACHPGIGAGAPSDLALREQANGGCLAERHNKAPRYTLDASQREAMLAYMRVAELEANVSAFSRHQRLLERAGCARCHQRDTDRPSPLEERSRTIGGGYLQTVPYQRVPRLSDPHRKLDPKFMLIAVRDGIATPRAPGYTFRMPAFGSRADELVEALAESDGGASVGPSPTSNPSRVDPTAASLVGPELVGSRGFGCISCHPWAGKQLSQPDPGAVGPDLTRVTSRLRRDWFDRYLEDPGRFHPNTPMPAIFPRGRPATLSNVLEGDIHRQRDALWNYLSLGTAAPAPLPPPPFPIASPTMGEPAIVAQIPVRIGRGEPIESLCVLTSGNDLLVHDLGSLAPSAVFTGGRILRSVQGRTRRFLVDGQSIGLTPLEGAPWRLDGRDVSETVLHGYDRLDDGARIRMRSRFTDSSIEIVDTFRLVRDVAGGRLVRRLDVAGVEPRVVFEARLGLAHGLPPRLESSEGEASITVDGASATLALRSSSKGTRSATFVFDLPARRDPEPWRERVTPAPEFEVGALERPGYRAVMFPRLKTVAGNDRVMPSALAVEPGKGRLFVGSLETGELFTVEDPRGDSSRVVFRNHARGLFQDLHSMLAEQDGLYLLHRRNLTRATDGDGDGKFDRFDRVALLPHGIADSYDYPYGLVRDSDGGFVVSFAPYASTSMPGSGGAVLLKPGAATRELAFGMRNPLGWTKGPQGDVFFTDNQGEWVAANKLCHLQEGRFHGFPNPAQREHATRPMGRTAVWVPYAWARSINGVAYDDTGGRFGPFPGQFYLAELMFGGAIIRASVERVNGEYQGACFPFWGKGLMGPVSLTFDPRGHLFVGGITEPGWMAQPDRGALFRIDYTGEIPFEIETILSLPDGFRVVFTRPVELASASALASYRVERYRYEYTGAYGSPELDRTTIGVASGTVAADRRSVDLRLPGLARGHVYRLTASGVRSAQGEPLVNDTGAYTLNAIPSR